SPYYQLVINEVNVPKNLVEPGHDPKSQLVLFVNHCYMQALLDPDIKLTPEGERNARFKQVADFARQRLGYYELPHIMNKNNDVLVVGAGAGGDVRAALTHGARYIDAVEIDPETIKVGNKYNEAYSSPIVHIHCDDARSFINKTTRKYDLVYVACL